MECLSLELKKVRSIREHLEANPESLEREDRPTDVVLWLIELVIPCSIPCLEEL